jgi:16S rRNA (cytosine967-C5)-methyltransferase
MIAPARIAAYETVLAVAAGRADLPSALARARRGQRTIATGAAGKSRPAQLLAERGGSSGPRAFPAAPSRLTQVLAILRISIFQLLHLDRVPASAVVDDAVELTRKVGKRSAAGFVNALLRRVSRERTQLPLPSGPPIDLLSITLSHPRWLAERWLARHGADAAERWARFDNASPSLTLRVNTLVTTRDALARDLAAAGVETEPARFHDGPIVTGGNRCSRRLRNGCNFRGGRSVAAVGVRRARRQRIRRAPPGGKTTQMAASMRDDKSSAEDAAGDGGS